jgi:hypothetical protein
MEEKKGARVFNTIEWQLLLPLGKPNTVPLARPWREVVHNIFSTAFP